MREGDKAEHTGKRRGKAARPAEKLAGKSAGSRALSEPILEALPHAVIGIDAGTIVYANKGVEGTLGWKAEELLGRDAEVLYPPHGASLPGNVPVDLATKRGKGKSSVGQVVCRRKDGKDIVCSVRKAPMGNGSGKRRFVAVYEEVKGQRGADEALKASEEKYRGIYENVPAGIFQSTPDGRFLSVNPALALMHGYSGPEEMVADPGSDVWIHKEERAAYLRCLEEDGFVRGLEGPGPPEGRAHCLDVLECPGGAGGRRDAPPV